MNTANYIKPKLGIVTRYLTVPELIVRSVPKHNYYPELDGAVQTAEGEIVCTDETIYEDRLQGRLINATKSKLAAIKYDLSYYDSSGRFLGLDKSRFLEEDELDIDDHLPIDHVVRIPDDTTECVFNVRAKIPGRIGPSF